MRFGSALAFSILSLPMFCAFAEVQKQNDGFGKLPLLFEQNQGQADPGVSFLARASTYTVAIRGNKAELYLGKGKTTRISLSVVGAAMNKQAVGAEPLESFSSYFVGNDASKWVRHAPHFATVRAAEIRPGVDLVFHGGPQQSLEYDIQLAPGADASDLRLRIEGAGSLRVDAEGALVIHSVAGDVREHKPVAYQDINGKRVPVDVSHAVLGPGEVALQLGKYNKSRALVIDPVVTYATYLGGTSTTIPAAVAVDSAGNAFVAGFTTSSDFPATTGLAKGGQDGFLSKLNSSGTALLYSIFVGGSASDVVNGIALDSLGNAFVTGDTSSTDFPVTITGTTSNPGSFVAKFDPSGNLLASRYIGVSSTGRGAAAIQVDNAGNVYVAGATSNSGLATTSGSLLVTKPSAAGSSGFLVKYTSSLSPIYATYIGGNGSDTISSLAVDSQGNAYVAGGTSSTNLYTSPGAVSTTLKGAYDGFLTEVNAQGNNILYSTYLGGFDSDQVNALALDAGGNVYLAGATGSNFPTTPGAFLYQYPYGTYRGFIAKISTNGAGLIYASYLPQLALAVTVDASSHAFVLSLADYSFSPTPGALHDVVDVAGDLLLVEVASAGDSLVYATEVGLGGYSSQGALALDTSGGLILAASTSSATFPTTSNALQPNTVSAGNATGVVERINFANSQLCDTMLSSNSSTAPFQGTSGVISLTLAEGCPWEILASSFLTVSPLRGFGSATLNWAVSPNTDTTSRVGSLSVNAGFITPGSNTFVVTQSFGSCSDPQFAMASANFGSSGGQLAIAINWPSSCAWNLAGTVPPWLKVTASTMYGPGTLSIVAAPNVFISTRSATIQIGGKTIPISQGAGTCTISISPTTLTVPATANTNSLALATGPGCAWTALPSNPWVQLVGSSSGQGNATLSFNVANNPGSLTRTATIQIGYATLQLTQQAGPAGGAPASYSESLYSAPNGKGVTSENIPIGLTSVIAPLGAVYDSAGNLYFIDDAVEEVRRVDTTGIVTTVAGGGSASPGDGGLATAALLSGPVRIAIDNTGSLYFTENGNYRIRKITNGIISTIAGTGARGFSGDGGPATAATVDNIGGIAVDQNYNVYFTDGNRIRKIDTAGIISTIAGTSTSAFSGDGGPAANALLDYPRDIAIDASGNLLFIDSGNQRIRKITTQGLISTFAGNGQYFVSNNDGVPATSTSIGYALGLTFDPYQALLFYSTGSHSLRSITSDGIIHTLATSNLLTIGSDIAYGPTGSLVFSQMGALISITPDPNFCSFTFGSVATVPAIGGMVTVPVTPSLSSCTWRANGPAASWITTVSGSGVGSGTATFTVAANTGTVARSTSFTIGGQTINISQAGAVALLFVPITPCRIIDTRIGLGATAPAPYSLQGGGTSAFAPLTSTACSIPPSAQAYAANVTVVPKAVLGYLSIWPAGQPQPVVSTLNSLDGRIKANAAIVPAGNLGNFDVFATNDSELIVDISGYFVPSNNTSALAFYPVAPCRLVDTRTGSLGISPATPLSAGVSRTLPLLAGACSLPASAQAYSLNFTVIPKTGSLGYLTVSPTGVMRPVVSTLNAATGTVTANAAFVPAGTNGSIDVFATDATDLLVDINGYFAPPGAGGLSFYPVSPCRVFDSRSQSGATPITGQTTVDVQASGCGTPSNAQAYVLNATVVPTNAGLGYLALFPNGSAVPVVSTLNAFDAAITNNMAVVTTNDTKISAFTSNSSQLILDISGFFAQ